MRLRADDGSKRFACEVPRVRLSDCVVNFTCASARMKSAPPREAYFLPGRSWEERLLGHGDCADADRPYVLYAFDGTSAPGAPEKAAPTTREILGNLRKAVAK